MNCKRCNTLIDSRKKFCDNCQKQKQTIRSKNWRESNRSQVKEYQTNYGKNYYQKLRSFKNNDELFQYLWRKHLLGNSKKNNIGSLTKDEVFTLLENQKYKCKITKIEFNSNPFFLPSIDRIDSDKDYTFSNCQIILTGINLIKNKYSMEDLNKFILALKKG
jgi:hypothetical protein